MNCSVYIKGKKISNEENTWTNGQMMAINTCAKNIYVSAAAGSGKTSVLTQRIIDKIQNKLDIDDFLVTTFTKAAAGDLKKKIEKAINKKLLDEPDNLHLLSQLSKISTSDICTMDSFFFDLVTDNTNALGLPSNFGIIEKYDETNIDNEILEEMIYDYSDGTSLFSGCECEDSIERFKNLLSVFGEPNNPSTIIPIIKRLHGKYSMYTDIKGTILSSLDSKTDFFSSPWYQYIVSLVEKSIDALEKAYEYFSDLEDEYKNTKGVKIDGFYNQKQFYENYLKLYKECLDALIEKDLNAGSYLFETEISSTGREIKKQKILKSSLSPLFIKGDVYNLLSEIFDQDEETLNKYVHDTYIVLNDLSDFILDFHNREMKEKIRRKLFSFNDITRFTYNLITDENGNPNETCSNIGSRFKEIYIDEFQDTNEIQYKIFELLSRDSNLFIVGDVKQSIYGFRDSKPEILNDKILSGSIRKVEMGDKVNEDESIKIFLSQNFRSKETVIDSVNKIFDTVAKVCNVFPYEKEDRLDHARKEIFVHEKFQTKEELLARIDKFKQEKGNEIQEIIVYSSEDTSDFGSAKIEVVNEDNIIESIASLKSDRQSSYGINEKYVDYVFSYGSYEYLKEADEIFNPKTELLLCQKMAKKEKEELPLDTPYYDEKIDFNSSYLIVSKINELHDKYKYDYEDIVVLVRNNKDGNEIADLLEKYNIPCSNTNYTYFFDNPEIMFVVNLLQVINNSLKEMYVAGSIISPIYKLDLSDLIKVKSIYRNRDELSLYDILKLYVEENKDDEILREKIEKYLDDISYFKKYLSRTSIYQLIDKIYTRTNLNALFMFDDEFDYSNVRDNLAFFRDFVYKYERGKQKSIYDLLLYIDYLKANSKEDINKETIVDIQNCVTITTLHSSKGLEYPVVILANGSTSFYGSNSGSYNYDIAKNMPIAISLSVNEDNVYMPNVRIKPCLRSINKYYNKEEAIDEELRLFYVGMTRAREKLIIVGEPAKTVISDFSNIENVKYNFSNKANKTYYNDYLKCILATEYYIGSNLNVKIEKALGFDYNSLFRKGKTELKSESIGTNDEEIKSLTELFKKRFEFKYPNIDESFIKSKLYISMIYPGILDYDETKPDEILEKENYFNDEKPLFIRKIPELRRAGDVGTIMHTFMSFLNLNNVDNYGLDYELDRMIKDELMEKADVEVLMKNKLENFCKSSLAHEIRKAKEIYRETRFFKPVPAYMFSTNADRQAYLKEKNVEIIIQGQVDLLMKNDSDEWILVDYKTDFSSRNYEVKRDIAIRTLKNRHSLQLSLYKYVCEQLFNIKIDHTLLYSFAIDDTIELTSDDLDIIKNLERK